MEHKKYKSIAKTYDVKTIEHYKRMGYNQGLWYVSEKVHGSNFSFISKPNDSPVLHCERDAILENYQGTSEYKNFFNHQNIESTKYFDKQVKELSKKLGKSIQVYTEFYGTGITNKPHIPYYAIPEGADGNEMRNFIVIDIRIIGEVSVEAENEDEVASDKYLSLTELIDACDSVQLPLVEILFVGTMEQCIAFDTNYKSILAKNGGLDEDAEGIVIKPWEALFDKQGNRVILKHVADKFSGEKLPDYAVKHKEQKTAEANKHFEHAAIIEARNNAMRVSQRAAGLGISSADKNKFGVLVLAVTADIVEEVEKELSIKLKDDQVKKAVVPLVKAFLS